MAETIYDKELIEEFLKDPEHSSISHSDLAKALKNLANNEPQIFEEYLEKIPNEYLGDIALELPEKYLKKVITNLENDDLVEIVEELDSDDATDLLQDIEEIDEQKAKTILSSLDKEDQEEIKKLRKYDEHEAGAHMQTELFEANIEEIVRNSINRFKKLKEEDELDNVHQVFITGTFKKLMFIIPLEELILFDFEKTFKEQIKGREDDFKPIFARDTDNIEEVAQIFK